MGEINVGIHTNKETIEFVTFEKHLIGDTVMNFKEAVAGTLPLSAGELEMIYDGLVLDNDIPVSSIDDGDIVHVFEKTEKYKPYIAKAPETLEHDVQSLFKLISNIQINVNSRVSILQKILTEYPEFRRNLGAQSLIRDSVLFNTLHEGDVIKNIEKEYPLICDAARFIVDTVKKELARTTTVVADNSTDTSTSSEEENLAENAYVPRLRRQLLAAAALDQAGPSTSGSQSRSANEPSTSASAQRSEPRRVPTALSNALARAFETIGATGGNTETNTTTENTSASRSDLVELMDTSETPEVSSPNEDSNELPTMYRNHQYAEQMRLMAQMGLLNHTENAGFLSITNGNVENAINLIISTGYSN